MNWLPLSLRGAGKDWLCQSAQQIQRICEVQQQRSNLLLISMSITWLFCGWLWIQQSQKDFLRKENVRGESLAVTLAALNKTPLQSHLEPLVSLGDVPQNSGVVEAIIADFQGKVVAPISHFGESTIAFKKNRGDLVFEKEILGLNREFLGKAFLLFHPGIPSFVFLQILFLLPVVAGIVICLCFYLRRKERPTAQNMPAVVCPHSFDWLSLLQRWMGQKVYLFDEEGNLLAAAQAEEKGHLLDLFPETAAAQNIMTLFQKAKAGEDFATHSLETMKMGSWREKDGTKRFLLACH